MGSGGRNVFAGLIASSLLKTGFSSHSGGLRGAGNATENAENSHAADWVEAIEGSECSSAGVVQCSIVGGQRHFKFPAGVFTVSRQVWVPENTVIEGASNPNTINKATKPDYSSQTVFVASDGVSDFAACYCQNLERSWEPLSRSNPYHCKDLTNEQVKAFRKGFLLSSNTVIRNIAYQGRDTLRPSDNGALCGGGVFETPGCVHNQCKFDYLKTGDGRPVHNVVIENVRLNDYLDDPRLASQLAVWVAQTTDSQTPTSNVMVKGLVAMFLHADGINFHGFVQNAMVDDCYIQNTGDDIYAVWGSNFDTKDIVFQNSVAVDAGRARDNHYGSCVAVYGAKEATFRNLTCFAPEWNTHDCYDPKNNGNTCNGCLGIIKESFDADYSGSSFTFMGNKFYQVKRTEDHGHQGYDLTNPRETGRAQVCNNEWKRGGLIVREDEIVRKDDMYKRLGGVAVNEGNAVDVPKYNCDLSCCKEYCTEHAACRSFAWSGNYASCFLKDGSPAADQVKGSTRFATYVRMER